MNTTIKAGQLKQFLNKFHDRSLGIKDFDWIFLYLVMPLYLGPAFASLVFIDSETALGNLALHLSLKIVLTPWFIVLLWVGSHCLPKQASIPIQLGRAIIALIAAIVLSYVSLGYFILYNAATGSNEQTLVSGPIVKKRSYSARYAGNQSEITIQYQGRNVTLSVTKQEYAVLKDGDVYARKMKLGGLGYYYNWGIAAWK
ncbi:MAG: hypothetical protein V4568_08375 [Pseudomonadota bacterium]